MIHGSIIIVKNAELLFYSGNHSEYNVMQSLIIAWSLNCSEYIVVMWKSEEVHVLIVMTVHTKIDNIPTILYYFLVGLVLPDTTTCSSLFLGKPEVSNASSSSVCIRGHECVCVQVYNIGMITVTVK